MDDATLTIIWLSFSNDYFCSIIFHFVLKGHFICFWYLLQCLVFTTLILCRLLLCVKVHTILYIIMEDNVIIIVILLFLWFTCEQFILVRFTVLIVISNLDVENVGMFTLMHRKTVRLRFLFSVHLSENYPFLFSG